MDNISDLSYRLCHFKFLSFLITIIINLFHSYHSKLVFIGFFIKFLPFCFQSLPLIQRDLFDTMGQTLSEPVTCKATTIQQNEYLFVGTSSMQGNFKNKDLLIL